MPHSFQVILGSLLYSPIFIKQESIRKLTQQQ